MGDFPPILCLAFTQRYDQVIAAVAGDARSA